MRSRLLGISLTIVGIALLLGCENPLGEGDYVGIILNQSSYTLNVDDPLDVNKYFRLKPGEQTKRYALQDQRYTFKAHYATDGTLYASASIRINSVKDDAEADGLTYDWAVIFTDPTFWGRIAYYS